MRNWQPSDSFHPRCNLNDYVEANLIYDKESSEAEKTDLLSSIPLASGMVMSGQKIMDRGEVDQRLHLPCAHLFRQGDEAPQFHSGRTYHHHHRPGTLRIFILVMMFTSYLTLFRKDYFDKPRSITMLYAMITLFPIFVSLMMKHNFFSVYIIPFAMAPIFVRVFMDSRTAFITPCHDDSHLCGSCKIPVRVHHRTAGIRPGGHLQSA